MSNPPGTLEICGARDERYNSQNWAGLASLYQPDVLLVNTSYEKGSSHIRGEIAGKSFSEQEHLENTVTILHQGSPAVIHMNFSYTHKGGSAKKHGYARVVKHEEDGEWKFAHSVSANFVFIPT